MFYCNRYTVETTAVFHSGNILDWEDEKKKDVSEWTDADTLQVHTNMYLNSIITHYTAKTFKKSHCTTSSFKKILSLYSPKCLSLLSLSNRI